MRVFGKGSDASTPCPGGLFPIDESEQFRNDIMSLKNLEPQSI